LDLSLGDIEEQIAKMMPPEPEKPSAPSRPTSASVEPARRKPIRRPLRDSLPRDLVEHAASCTCPKCGGALRPLGEDRLRAGRAQPRMARLSPACCAPKPMFTANEPPPICGSAA
jgi:hypothetical protein